MENGSLERKAMQEAINSQKQFITKFLSADESNWVLHKQSGDLPSYILVYALFIKASGRGRHITTRKEVLASEGISGVQFAPGCSWVYGLDQKSKGREVLSVDLYMGEQT